MTNTKTISIHYPLIGNASCIEEILCLSTLVSNGELLPNATLDQSQEFFENEVEEDCGNCPFMLTCLACIINE